MKYFRASVALFTLFAAASAFSMPILNGSAILFSPPNVLRGLHETSSSSNADVVNRITPVKPRLSAVESVITAFNEDVISQFRNAWVSVHNGNMPYECVILVLRSTQGYQFRRLPLTYEHKKSTFAWHPGIVAVVHTHPNDCPPKPQPDDIKIAEERGVPMFTLSNRGMFVYDPQTDRTTKVLDGLLWLQPSNWEKRPALK